MGIAFLESESLFETALASRLGPFSFAQVVGFLVGESLLIIDCTMRAYGESCG